MTACPVCGDPQDHERDGHVYSAGNGFAKIHPVGRKYDQEKPDWSLLPLDTMTGTVKVLTMGAKKYDRENWRKVPDGVNRYFAAAMRHLAAWQAGEEKDSESGESHLDHAMCCLIFLKGLTDAKKD